MTTPYLDLGRMRRARRVAAQRVQEALQKGYITPEEMNQINLDDVAARLSPEIDPYDTSLEQLRQITPVNAEQAARLRRMRPALARSRAESAAELEAPASPLVEAAGALGYGGLSLASAAANVLHLPGRRAIEEYRAGIEPSGPGHVPEEVAGEFLSMGGAFGALRSAARALGKRIAPRAAAALTERLAPSAERFGARLGLGEKGALQLGQATAAIPSNIAASTGLQALTAPESFRDPYATAANIGFGLAGALTEGVPRAALVRAFRERPSGLGRFGGMEAFRAMQEASAPRRAEAEAMRPAQFNAADRMLYENRVLEPNPIDPEFSIQGFQEPNVLRQVAPQTDIGTVTPFTTERGPGTWPSTTPLEPPPL